MTRPMGGRDYVLTISFAPSCQGDVCNNEGGALDSTDNALIDAVSCRILIGSTPFQSRSLHNSFIAVKASSDSSRNAITMNTKFPTACCVAVNTASRVIALKSPDSECQVEFADPNLGSQAKRRLLFSRAGRKYSETETAVECTGGS